MPTGQQYGSNAPQTNLVGGINNSQATGTVISFTGYPATPFTAAIDIGTPTQELVDVTGVSGNSITSMNRGVDGSSAQSHSNNATFEHVSIGRDFREARSHIDASASNDAVGHAVHGLAVGSSVVGTTDTQTLTNKTLTSPTITGLSTSNPAITGTVTGAAQYQNITAGTTTTAGVPLTVNGLASQTGDILDVEANGTKVLVVGANGATGAGAVSITPTDTGTASLVVNAPSGLTVDIFDLKINSVTKASLGSGGQFSLAPGPLSISGITGATTVSRYAGGTAGGPPVSGTFSTGDYVVDTVNAIIWVCTAGGSPGTWQSTGTGLIVATTLGSPAASVTFSTIPAYYRHLILMSTCRASGSPAAGFTDLRMQLNGDTAAHYSQRHIFISSGGAPPTVTNTSSTTDTVAGYMTASNAGAATLGGYSETKIGAYSNANWQKHITFDSSAGDIVTVYQTGSGGSLWNSASAVTSLKVYPGDGSNLTTNSTFALYGVM